MNSSLANVLAAEEEKLLACVHCGLCLEACPTYVATGDENDSPRGRIYLMRAVQEGRLAHTSATFERHIDRCLGCRACESACPAGVEYGRLLEAARQNILITRRGFGYSLLRFVLKRIWPHPVLLRTAFACARFFRDSGLARLLRKSGLPGDVSPRLEFALRLLEGSQRNGSAIDGQRGVRVRAAGEVKTSALLFKGCVNEGLFSRVNDATVRVLAVNGCRVESPSDQVCCGALHAHAGDLEGARKLARRNVEAFGENEANRPIVTNAGGCGAMLASYSHLLSDDEKYAGRARAFSARVRDVGQQLEAIGFRNGASIGSGRTTYDTSCHLLHGQQGADASLQMLWAIPDLNFALLEGSDVCCGGAGVYNLMEPELSEQVLAEKLDGIERAGAEVLATGNAGCQMQIAAGAQMAGIKLKVCHPVELLDESYRRAGFYALNENAHE